MYKLRSKSPKANQFLTKTLSYFKFPTCSKSACNLFYYCLHEVKKENDGISSLVLELKIGQIRRIL